MKKHTSLPVLTETLSVRLPLSAFRALVDRANAESRTLSNLVRVLLARRVADGTVPVLDDEPTSEPDEPSSPRFAGRHAITLSTKPEVECA